MICETLSISEHEHGVNVIKGVKEANKIKEWLLKCIFNKSTSVLPSTHVSILSTEIVCTILLHKYLYVFMWKFLQISY